MKRLLVITFCVFAFSGTASAGDAKTFIAALEHARSAPQVAEYRIYASRRVGLSAKAEDIAALGPAYAQAKAEAKAAYRDYITGKQPPATTSAKHVYAAWLTMIDALGSNGDPNDISDTPAGMAYSQAANEMTIDDAD